MLAEAKREAERIIKEARDQQARLISDEEVYKQAERGAAEGHGECGLHGVMDMPCRRIMPSGTGTKPRTLVLIAKMLLGV